MRRWKDFFLQKIRRATFLKIYEQFLALNLHLLYFLHKD